MNKREIVHLFRELYPALAIPSDLRKIRTGYVRLGPGHRVMGIERLRSTVYGIRENDAGQHHPCSAEVTDWREIGQRLPVMRLKYLLIVVDYHDHAKGVDYQHFYLKP